MTKPVDRPPSDYTKKQQQQHQQPTLIYRYKQVHNGCVFVCEQRRRRRCETKPILLHFICVDNCILFGISSYCCWWCLHWWLCCGKDRSHRCSKMNALYAVGTLDNYYVVVLMLKRNEPKRCERHKQNPLSIVPVSLSFSLCVCGESVSSIAACSCAPTATCHYCNQHDYRVKFTC